MNFAEAATGTRAGGGDKVRKIMPTVQYPRGDIIGTFLTPA